MRLKNKIIEREYRIVKIPRKNSDPLEFKVAGLPMSLERDYTAICPQPKPPIINVVGKKAEGNYDDPSYIKAFDEWSDLRKYYQIYVVLQYDENIEWDVRPVDYASMLLLRKSILETGLSVGDIGLIISAATEASNLTDEAIDKAKGNF